MGFENLTGQVLGQYELRELLGVGGMGAVYRAYQAGLQREVAVKVLPTTLAGEAGYIERFIREARMAGALEHPHIVRIYDYGTQGDISYLVMALLRGGSLSQRINQREEKGAPRPSLGEVSTMLNQMASALDYAHHEGVLHRDIKPANIMFDNQGRAYLSDFGIAKLMGANTALTGTGVAMGSPSYMPPEQWMGRDLTPAADQYALGVTVYQTLSGRLPFEADSAAQLMYKHFNEDPTPLNITRIDLPAAVNIVLTRAMSKDPERRFPNMTSFAQAFESAVEGNKGDATNFFVYKLRQDKPRAGSGTPMPTGSGAPPRTPTGVATGAGTPSGGRTYAPVNQTGQVAAPAYRNPVVILVGVLLVALIGLVAVLLSGGGQPSDEQLDQTTTAVAAVLLQNLTQTAAAIPTNTPTETATPTETPTATSTDTPTETATATDTPTETATATVTDEPTATPTDTATDAPTSTPTDTATTAPTTEPTQAVVVTATDEPEEGIPDLQLQTVSFAEPVIVELDGDVPARPYVFNATAGMVVTILAETAGGGLDPALRLLRADGTPQAQSNDISPRDRNAQISNFTIREDGEYVVVVRRQRLTNGSVRLTITEQTTGSTDTNAQRGCPSLLVGCIAVTQNRELILREEAAPGAASVATLPVGTEVTLLEGPVIATGFRWWLVEMSDGTQGWLVERLSLTPVLAPAP